MDCNCNNKEKRSYHFNITEVIDNKIQDVMSFNFGGHHDLAKMVANTEAKGNLSDKHAKEFVVGMRLLHHVLKKNADNELFRDFFPVFEEFKHKVKAYYHN